MKRESLNNFSKKIYSQFGEDGILLEILNRLKNKNLDAIVMNSLNDDGSGFDSDTNQVTFITELISKKINLNSKSVVAHEILTEISNL